MDMQLNIEEHTAGADAWPSFTIRVSDFHKAISVVKGAVERTTLVPILTHVLIEARDGRLILTCTDMEISLTKTIEEVNVRAPGVMAVPAVLLADTLSRMQQDGIADIIASDGSIVVKVGKSRATISTENHLEYPTIATPDFPCQFALQASILEGAIAHVGFAADAEAKRQYLCGMFVHSTDRGVIRLCATDTNALGEIKVKAEIENIPPVIIPMKAIGQIKSCLSSDVPVVNIQVSNRLMRFTFGDAVLTTKLIDGTYPDYQQIIPPIGATPMISATPALRQAVRLVAGMSEGRFSPVVFELSEGCVRLSSGANEKASATADLAEGEINYEGPSVRVVMNGRALGEALGCLVGDAEFHVRDEASPVLLLDTKNPDVTYVLSALRF